MAGHVPFLDCRISRLILWVNFKGDYGCFDLSYMDVATADHDLIDVSGLPHALSRLFCFLGTCM